MSLVSIIWDDRPLTPLDMLFTGDGEAFNVGSTFAEWNHFTDLVIR